MAKVAPVPVDLPGAAPQFDGVVTAEAATGVLSSRRKSTEPRFDGLSDAEKNEARTFRALGQPHTRYSLLATIVVCTLLVLLVGVLYAANERMADANPVLQTAMRGLIVGIWTYFQIGPI